MARKETTFIADTGRDAGKEFLITEMSASQAENWAFRVILAIGNAGIEIPEGLASQGMAGLMAIGYMNLLKIPFESAKPLLDEMMTCVQIMPSANLGFTYQFFFRRKTIDFGIKSASQSTRKLIEYQATTQAIATVLSSRLATLHELDTVYSLEDMWILLEINAVDRHNAYTISQIKN